MNRFLARTAAALSAGAAVIHAAEAPDHFAEWWGYGAFFAAAAAAQALLAVLLIRAPWHGGPDARLVTAAGIAGNTAIVTLYAVTRTIGIPLVGPEAGEVEPLTRSGLVAAALEVLLIGHLVMLIRVSKSSAASDEVRRMRPAAAQTASSTSPVSLGAVAAVALLTFVALATTEAIPAVIAQQEGGAGPGSGLVLGQVVEIASVLLGAAIAAALLSRHPPAAVFLPATILLASAIGSLFLNEHASMAWIVVAHVLAGLGLGLLMTGAFALAISTRSAIRPVAIGLMILATFGVRVVVGIPDRGGLPALAIAAGAALTLSWRLSGITSDARSEDRSAGSRATAITPVVGVLVAAVGVLAALAGSDSSGIAATMLGRPLGLFTLDAIDAWRSALLVAGLALLVVGVAAVARQIGLERSTIVAAVGVALVSLSAAGVTSLLVFSAPVSSFTPGERAITPVGLAAVVGVIAGVALGSAWNVGRWQHSRIGPIGAVVLVGATLLAMVTVDGRMSVTPVLVVLAAAVGVGAGSTLIALWLDLSESRPDQRAKAAAIGVVGATFGLALGASIARGDALAIATGQTVGHLPGGVLLAAAAVAGLACLGLNRLLGADGVSAPD